MYTCAFGSFNKIKQVRIKMHGKKTPQTVTDVNTHLYLLQRGRHRQDSDFLSL